MTTRRWPARILRLPHESGQWDEVSGRTHAVVLHGAATGGPANLSGRLLEVLIDVERRGLHIVLVAGAPSDLDTAVAAICRHVLAADRATLSRARTKWGVNQVLAVQSLTDTRVIAAVRSLPTPASRTLRRRLHTRSVRLRRLASRIRHAGRITR